MSIISTIKKYIRKFFNKAQGTRQDNYERRESDYSYSDFENENRKREVKLARIPAKYDLFPRFQGNCTYEKEKKEIDYDRYTMDFNNVSLDDFRNYEEDMIRMGFRRSTDVRWDNNNLYIIYEPERSRDGYGFLHLVYHIKK